MKKIENKISIIVITSLLFIAALSSISYSNAASPLYVNADSGDDGWDGTSPTYTSGLTGPMKTIQTAINAVTPGGTVNVADGTYNEDIQIDRNVNLEGQSQSNTIIQGTGTDSVIYNGASTVNINKLTVKNGDATTGGGILNGGTLTISNCNIQENAAQYGGGIVNYGGTMTIINCNIHHNTGRTYGGGIVNYVGQLNIFNSNIHHNTADVSAGGIYNTATMNIDNSYIQENTATSMWSNGGGIYDPRSYGGTLTITDSHILQNTAAYGAGISCMGSEGSGSNIITNTIISGNTASGRGGGMVTYLPTTITNSVIKDNQARYEGAGIVQYNHGLLTITSTLIENNVLTDSYSKGGAIYSEAYADAPLNIHNSKLINNQAADGGAIYSDHYGVTTITNSLISGNTATNQGGFFYKYDDRGSVEMHFNRIIDNTAPVGANIYNHRNNEFNAENNWWGSNNGPSGIVNSESVDIPVVADPYLILEFNANPSTITQGGSAVLTAHVNRNSDGVLVGNAENHIPDGTPITFTTNLGNLGSKSITVGTVNGVATATLLADESAGTASLTATLDYETLNASVSIKAKPVPPQPDPTPVPPTPANAKTVPMQKTGTPLAVLALAVLMVIGGILSTKK